ncbi:MAG: alpha-L-fucosidase, partial [Saprospiraceae bacterium]
MRSLFLLLLLFTALRAVSQAPYHADWNSLDARPTPAWWLDVKFGIFIHWGVYSVPASTEKGRYAE